MMRPIRPGVLDVVILIAGYVILDAASYIHPLHGLNITPWNPAPALGLLYLLQFGKYAALPTAIAILIADAWVRSLPIPFTLSCVLSVLLMLGYWVIAEALRRRLASRNMFTDRRGLFDWACIVVVGTLLNSALFVGTLVVAGLIPGWNGLEAFVHHWVGDCVGVLVSMPMLWMLLDERGRSQLRAIITTRDAPAQLAVTLVALWIAFGIGAAADFKYFYALFLPIMWAAARHGLAGAVFGVAIVQTGIICAVLFLEISAITALEIQTLAAVLCLFGFFIGLVVDEKQRVSAELRQTLRLAAAGEMAGALAHELNQPLTALSAYGTACEQLLVQGETGERLRETIQRMVAESFRAAEVVRRLRDFFRTGATRLERLELADLIIANARSLDERARKSGTELIIEPVAHYTLMADRMQLEVVLRNLLSNAFDAVATQAPGQRRVRVSTRPEGAGRVCVRIEDSGPGLSGIAAAKLFKAFQSSKSDGMGLGLVISRAIVEAHGGHLLAEVADHGIFNLILPTEDN